MTPHHLLRLLISLSSAYLPCFCRLQGGGCSRKKTGVPPHQLFNKTFCSRWAAHQLQPLVLLSRPPFPAAGTPAAELPAPPLATPAPAQPGGCPATAEGASVPPRLLPGERPGGIKPLATASLPTEAT